VCLIFILNIERALDNASAAHFFIIYRQDRVCSPRLPSNICIRLSDGALEAPSRLFRILRTWFGTFPKRLLCFAASYRGPIAGGGFALCISRISYVVPPKIIYG
jgi:hypothetical protein